MSAALPPRVLPPAELARWCGELEARCDALSSVLEGVVKRVSELETELDQTDGALNVALEELAKLRGLS